MDTFDFAFALKLTGEFAQAAYQMMVCDCESCQRAVAERRSILRSYCDAHDVSLEAVLAAFRKEEGLRLRKLKAVKWDLVPWSFSLGSDKPVN